jgi:Zn-dependent peptidase ImmA (M78 family)
LCSKSEELGILVMINGVVSSNTRRKLDPREFRGFALVDPLAPVIFVNGADTKAAQIFTLVHEVAHEWLGRGGLDDVDLSGSSNDEVEVWCNRVAGEILVPQALLREDFNAAAGLGDELDRLARTYKVGTLVVLRGLRDAEFISATDYPEIFRAELSRVLDLIAERGGSGGNFYNTLPIRVSRKFARLSLQALLRGKPSIAMHSKCWAAESSQHSKSWR